MIFHERMGNAMDDYVIDFDSLNYLRPETLAIMKLLVKKYNESKDDDVLQDGVVVSFDEQKQPKFQLISYPMKSLKI